MHRAWQIAAAAITLALASMPVQAHSSGPLAPRNECARVQPLAKFEIQLRAAVAARDADALLALVDDDILLDFGGGSGKIELRSRLSSPDYRLWDELGAVLRLGCGLTRDAEGGASATWPWYFSKDMTRLDAFEAFIVTGDNVRLRSAPSLTAPVIGSVSWDFVRMAEYPEEGAQFAPIETSDGRKGYMASHFLRSLVDYRLLADRDGDSWRLTVFVAGD